MAATIDVPRPTSELLYDDVLLESLAELERMRYQRPEKELERYDEPDVPPEGAQVYAGEIRFGGMLSARFGIRLHWSTDVPSTIDRARAAWDYASRYGLIMYDARTGNDLRPSEKRKGFNPKTAPAETAIIAPMAGG